MEKVENSLQQKKVNKDFFVENFMKWKNCH